MLVQHHIKYKEIHGADEIVLMDKGKHDALHKKLRKDGCCSIPAEELNKISKRAHGRSDLGKATKAMWRKGEGKASRKKTDNRYRCKHVQRIVFHTQVDLYISLYELFKYNTMNGNVYFSSGFNGCGKRKIININI